MKVAVDNYGCTRNKSDGELIKGQIESQEDFFETSIEDADVIILNTCGVKNKTQSKMMNRLKRYREKGKKVLVAGCLPKINKELLEEQKASMVSPDTIDKIPKALRKISDGKNPIYIDKEINSDNKSKLEMKRKIEKGITGIVPISDGCLGNCSYCGVKNARGNLKSYPEEKIINEVNKLIENGKKQIYLTGQDTGCYGKDKRKTDFPQLIQKIIKLKGEFKIRIGMMNPEHLKDSEIREKLIQSLNNSKIYNFLHIPVQSGSNKVLEDMNRRYTVEEFKEIIEEFKREVKNLNLATDIIVGYPTEGEEEFQETIDMVKEVKPDVTNISRFYPRPNTEAEKLDSHTSQVLKKRSRKLSKVAQKISNEKNKSYLNQKMEIMITRNTGKMMRGRTNNYKKIQIKDEIQSNLRPGKKLKAKISNFRPRGLTGKILEIM